MFQHSRVQRTDSVYIVIISNLTPPLDLCRNDPHSEEGGGNCIFSEAWDKQELQLEIAIRGGVVLDTFVSLQS